MVFLANLGVNLHVCLCGDLQVANAQTIDFLDISQKSSFPDWKLGSTGKSFPDENKIEGNGPGTGSPRTGGVIESSREVNSPPMGASWADS